ncbi:MAG: hypothetical protein IT577_05395 [Verrucomicrobiae bacterium]|nr:hypothetical protein [Verrucomicrobiae bacterium]
MNEALSEYTLIATKFYQYDEKLRFRVEVVRVEPKPPGGSHHCIAEVYLLRVGSPVGKVGQSSGDWSFKPGWLLVEDFPRVQATRAEDVVAQVQRPLCEYAEAYRRSFPLK